jgi:hypothetical protein
MIKKMLLTFTLLLLLVPGVSAYDEVDCSSDIVFEGNSCSQCFNWETKAQWDYIGLLKDDWINGTDSKKILYKEEQKKPFMVALNSAVWWQTPDVDWFWEYSSEFDALYSEDEEWYILNSWKRVTWLKSKEGHAYKLDNNTAAENTNIGLLVYPISTHVILSDWVPSIDDEEHKACVLFKSALVSENKALVVVKEWPKRLPDTGPSEYILLLILSMVIGFFLIKIRNKA